MVQEQTVDIIEEMLKDLNTDLVVSAVEDLNNDVYKLTVCNTQYLNTKYEVEIEEGVKVTVQSFKFNETVTIKVPSGYIPTVKTYTLPKPMYNHGTVRAVNNERSEIPNSKKFPYIFLLERMSERFNYDEEFSTDRISPLKMFFLTQYDENNWETNDHYEEIVKPMSNVRENFLNLLRKSKIVNDQLTFETEWEGTNYVRFGTYVEDSSNINSLFDVDVSGVSLEISVVFCNLIKCKDHVCNL